MYPLLTSVIAQFVDENGKPVIGGQVYTYEANTTTPKRTFADPDGNTPNTNPITLDAAGRARIYLEEGAYRVRVVDKKGVLVADTNKLSRYVTNNELAVFMSSVEDSLLELEKAKEAMSVMAQQEIRDSKDIASGIAGLDDNALIFPEQLPIYTKLGGQKYSEFKERRAPNTVYTNDKNVGFFLTISFSALNDGSGAASSSVSASVSINGKQHTPGSSASTGGVGNARNGFLHCYVPPKSEYSLKPSTQFIAIEYWLESSI